MKTYDIFDINLTSDIIFQNIPLSKDTKSELKIISANKSPINKSLKVFRKIRFKGKTWISFFSNTEEFAIRFHNYADFTIDTDGTLITYFKRKATSETTLAHLIADQVVPYALTLSGKMVFHSSTVKVGNTAVSFQAPSGSGKSTIAAYFSKRKHELLTDDSLLLEEKNNKIYAYPSYPGIRLWPNSIKNIYSDRIETKEVSQINSKRLINSNVNFLTGAKEPVHLKSIYFINNHRPTGIEILNPSEAFSLIIRNIFRADLNNKEINKKQFDFINKVLRFTDIYKLNYEMKYESLEKVYNLVTSQTLN